MGGNALKKIETRRYLKEEYFALVAELLPKLRELLKTECVMLESFSSKESFGDMDVLVKTGGLYTTEEMIQKVKDLLNPPPTDTFKNDNVFSFDYKELQIDLIFMRPEDMEMAFNFTKFGDCGNLVGKILHKFSTKYSFTGLRYVYRTAEDRVLGEIILTKDIKKILEFAGLNYSTWEKSFDTAEQVFDFVIGSKYFDADSFRLENLNSINRKRNAKRKMYHAFIEYCEQHNPPSNYIFNPDKSVYKDLIEEHFPGFKSQLIELEKKEAYLKALREKFNGKIVMQAYPELKGAILGKILDSFKSSFENFDVYLHDNDTTTIMTDFSKFMNKLT